MRFVLITETLLLKSVLKGRNISEKGYLVNYVHLCDFKHALSFIAGKIIQDGFGLINCHKRYFAAHWVISCEITHHCFYF